MGGKGQKQVGAHTAHLSSFWLYPWNGLLSGIHRGGLVICHMVNFSRFVTEVLGHAAGKQTIILSQRHKSFTTIESLDVVS